jgi:hypothetical protein
LVAPNGVGPAGVGPAILEKVVHSRGVLHQVPSGEGEGHRYGAERRIYQNIPEHRILAIAVLSILQDASFESAAKAKKNYGNT